MMAVTFNQALVSTDAEFIKRVRSSFENNFTRSVTTLKNILRHTGDESFPFDHNNIDQEEVTAVVSDLKQATQAVKELHMKFAVIRKHEEAVDELVRQ